MKFGVMGLGSVGGNMVLLARERGHEVVGSPGEMLPASEHDHDMPAFIENRNHASTMRGRLVELMKRGFEEHGGDLGSVEDQVEDTGEQVWGFRHAMEREIPMPLLARVVRGSYEPRDPGRPRAGAVAVLRNRYGGHPLEKR